MGLVSPDLNHHKLTGSGALRVSFTGKLGWIFDSSLGDVFPHTTLPFALTLSLKLKNNLVSFGKTLPR